MEKDIKGKFLVHLLIYTVCYIRLQSSYMRFLQHCFSYLYVLKITTLSFHPGGF